MESCSIKTGFFADGQAEPFIDFWNKVCMGKTDCEIPVKLDYQRIVSQECMAELNYRMPKSYFMADLDRNIPEPVIIVEAECIFDSILIPYSGGYSIDKDDLGLIIVCIDLISVFATIIFIYYLDLKQTEYIELFKMQTMQMSDFAIRVKNLPRDNEFATIHDLRAQLWNHFQDILFTQYCQDMLSQSKEAPAEIPSLCQVADITFGK
jgi:hypothetical protein